jgi:hypothetical protein
MSGIRGIPAIYRPLYFKKAEMKYPYQMDFYCAPQFKGIIAKLRLNIR